MGTTRCPRSANAEFILTVSLQRKARKAGWEDEHVCSPHPTSGQERRLFHLPFALLCCPLTRVMPNFFLGMKRAFWKCCIPATGPCLKQRRVGQGRRMCDGSRTSCAHVPAPGAGYRLGCLMMPSSPQHEGCSAAAGVLPHCAGPGAHYPRKKFCFKC